MQANMGWSNPTEKGWSSVPKYPPDAGGEIKIYDLLGQPMAYRQLAPNARLSIVDLPYIASGEYFYEIKSEDGYAITGKFIVTH